MADRQQEKQKDDRKETPRPVTRHSLSPFLLHTGRHILSSLPCSFPVLWRTLTAKTELRQIPAQYENSSSKLKHENFNKFKKRTNLVEISTMSDAHNKNEKKNVGLIN